MKETAGAPLSPNELARALKAGKEGRKGVKTALEELVSAGELIKTRGEKYGLPSRMNLVTGTLTSHADGYGFVCPEEGADVFVSAGALSGALHGDTVIARVEGTRQGGKRSGRVIRIVNRANKTVVGRFERIKGQAMGFVAPSEKRLLLRLIVADADAMDAQSNAMVVAEITRWPEKDTQVSGRITEILGDPSDADVETEVILRKYGLQSAFQPEVQAEASAINLSVDESDVAGRVDLRNKLTVTIDGENAKDFDDAVSIEKTARGYKLFVSIADVSHYVRPGTRLDAEAHARGTSVYFPGRCVPMLPEALSNGICSLNPHVDRLTLTAEMEFDGRGVPVKKTFFESVIKSAERLTYTIVARLLEGQAPVIEHRFVRLLPELKLMEELAGKLRERRSEAGSIDFDLPEPDIILDIEGKVEDIARAERNVAHRIIEEFMLAANRAVAEEFSSRDLPFLYRVHDEPDAEKITEFAEFVGSLGLSLEYGEGRVKSPKALQKTLKAVEGKPEERLVNHVLLRSMKQAVYSEVNHGHFGLAFSDYTHFTSPIRRYPDLIVHRLLRLRMKDKYGRVEQDKMATALPEIASHSSARERKAVEAERESIDLKKVQFMQDKAGRSFNGIVSGVTSFGFFVELEEYFVEGLVHVSSLGDDYYIYDEKRHTLTGERKKRRFRPADPVKVKINGVDIERRRIEMLLDEATDAPVKAGRRSKTSARRTRRAGR
ncbi:MAG: ribonuclease R [Deltaproteobacteria bacterium]|nr:ribonuclease R [Deltaproteobacteria bacterium]